MVKILSEEPLVFTVTHDEMFSLERLDVKHVALQVVFRENLREAVPKRWKDMGFQVVELGQVVDNVGKEREVKTKDLPQHTGIPLLSITFQGEAVPRVSKLRRKAEMTKLSTKYQVLLRVSKDDIVFSRIDLVDGAVAVIPDELDGYLVSKEFIVLRVKEGYSSIVDPFYVWMYLRSSYVKEFVKGVMKGVTGRHRVKWDEVKDMPFPLPDSEGAKDIVNKHLKDLKDSMEELKKAREKYNNAIAGLYELVSLG